jgi:hypothetical protein
MYKNHVYLLTFKSQKGSMEALNFLCNNYIIDYNYVGFVIDYTIIYVTTTEKYMTTSTCIYLCMQTC